MVRNAALLALVTLAASEQATLFPFIGPHDMKVKHEPKDGDDFHKFQNYCYNFIYAVVGKGDAKALQNLPSLMGRLCRASEADCQLYTESLRAAVEQKHLHLKLSRGSRPYADWCEDVYNQKHPTTTLTTTAMPLQNQSSHGLLRPQAPEKLAAGQPQATAAANAAKARLPLQLKKSAAAPTTTAKPLAAGQPQATAAAQAAKARLPLQLKKSAATPTTTAKPQAQAALPPLLNAEARRQAVKSAARAVAAERARRAQATATTTLEPSQATPAAAEAPAQAAKSPPDMTHKEIQDMEKDVGNFEHHFIADMTGHAIANMASMSMDKAQQLGGAEVAFDKASAAVNKMDSHEHTHHHRHHRSR